MDSRLYFHQYRRPRHSNPTFMSTNINHSLSFFNQKTHQTPSYFYDLPHSHNLQPYSKIQQTEKNSYLINNSIASKTPDKFNPSHINDKYNTINASFEQPLSNPRNSGRYSGGSSHERNHSNLSSYGSNSLSLNQKDIYDKQNPKYNIITMQPKDFDTSIRQHPKYTLQNKDELYYKRMADELQKKKTYQQIYKQKRSSMNNNTINPEIIAGKHTYGMDREKQIYSNRFGAQEQSFVITPQTVTNQYKLPQVNNNKNYKSFNPKLLNQMDELISLS